MYVYMSRHLGGSGTFFRAFQANYGFAVCGGTGISGHKLKWGVSQYQFLNSPSNFSKSPFQDCTFQRLIFLPFCGCNAFCVLIVWAGPFAFYLCFMTSVWELHAFLVGGLFLSVYHSILHVCCCVEHVTPCLHYFFCGWFCLWLLWLLLLLLLLFLLLLFIFWLLLFFLLLLVFLSSSC